MVAAVAYLVSPLLSEGWLFSELEAGAFPVNGDSISIPFAGFLVIWFAGLILIAVAAITFGFWKLFLEGN